MTKIDVTLQIDTETGEITGNYLEQGNAEPVEPVEPPQETSLPLWAMYCPTNPENLSVNGLLEQYKDISGNERHMKETNDDVKPAINLHTINGKPVITTVKGQGMNCPSELKDLLNSNKFTIIQVYQSTSTNETQCLFAANKNGTGSDGFQLAHKMYSGNPRGVYNEANKSLSPSFNNQDITVVGISANNTDMFLFDGEGFITTELWGEDNTDLGGVDFLKVGYRNDFGFEGHAMTTIILDESYDNLTVEQKTEIEHIISNGWGIDVNLGTIVEGRQEPTAEGFRFGINLASAEFTPQQSPGILNTHYRYPPVEIIDDVVDSQNTRVPFKWERLQNEMFGELNNIDLGLLKDVVDRITNINGQTCILDMHNYMQRYINGEAIKIGDDEVPVEALVDGWVKIATEFMDNDKVWFEIMNEPNLHTAQEVRDIMDAVVLGLRNAGITNKVIVTGTSFSGGHNWMRTGNGDAFADFSDTNYVIAVHQYIDGNNSGFTPDVKDDDTNSGVDRLRNVTDWARIHGHTLHLGEWNGGDASSDESSIAYQTLENMLNFMLDNQDVWIGCTLWAGGDMWPDSYIFKTDSANIRYINFLNKVNVY